MKQTKALVVLSGGQDSATCAAWARMVFDEIEFITFNYGQRHSREIDSAEKIANLLGGMWTLFDVPVLRDNPASSLTNGDLDTFDTDLKTGLPRSFVPGRNLVFLTMAASFAISRGIFDVVTGVCQTDYSGYPDCRFRTIRILEEAILAGNEGVAPRFRIHTPLMDLTKAETIKLAGRLPKGVEAVALSWTCYKGGEKPCGCCPACILRQKGFDDVSIKDPAL